MKIRSRSKAAANRRRLDASNRVRPVEPIRCPQPDCGSADTHVYSSKDRPVRYHRCRTCGHTFKSVEQPVRGQPLLKGE